MLVDDDPAILRICRRSLEDLEITVVEASSGTEAIGLWEEAGDRFAAAVLDFDLPGATGSQVLQHLRGSAPELPVVMISGSNIARDLDRMENVVFLAKPFRTDRFRELVRDALSAR
ncbi:MAG: hypothetical protein CL908_02575 [Deltaproteobacteria bacterium]|jgi:DNA-binding NtrC family response regulator|nr:hypothetical protein [Deltaproteobacteria bacterium]